MTDEQWVWVYANMALDNDEKLEGMCQSCRDEVTSDKRTCSHCGKTIEEEFVNPNFDKERFEKLQK